MGEHDAGGNMWTTIILVRYSEVTEDPVLFGSFHRILEDRRSRDATRREPSKEGLEGEEKISECTVVEESVRSCA